MKARALELVGLGLAIVGVAAPYIWRDMSPFITYPAVGVGVVLILYGFWVSRRETENEPDERNLEVADDSVVMGDVAGKVGARSVVIGATDAKGNTILTGTMAVGHGAQAGRGSIAVGSGAGAGLKKGDAKR